MPTVLLAVIANVQQYASLLVAAATIHITQCVRSKEKFPFYLAVVGGDHDFGVNLATIDGKRVVLNTFFVFIAKL